MAGYGDQYTDKKTQKLQKDIEEVYGEAYKEIETKLNQYQNKFSNKNEKYWKMVDAGEMSDDEYSKWLDGQIFQSEQWESKRDQIIKVLSNSNQEATKIINGGLIDTFAENANWTAYTMEHGKGINFGFGLYDKTAVTQLIKDNPDVLPKWKIDEKKDYIWNKKKVNRVVSQGIIQGKKLDEITKDLSNKLVAQNENLMKTFARTAMTGAQNSGRNQSLKDAKTLGIDVYKEWMATLDARTRDSHAAMDGEKQKVGDKWHPFKFSNGCRFPGDPLGPPHEVYNCRCTLVGDVEDYPAEYERRDNIDGVPIKNMTYQEWLAAKGGALKQPKIDYSKFGGKEIYDILKKYNDFDDFLDKSPIDDYITVMDTYKNMYNTPTDKAVDKAIKNIKNIGKETQIKKKVKETNELEITKQKLTDLQKQIQDVGADKTFSGIWYNQDVTYADWDAKKDSIQSKKDYYNQKIKEYEQVGDPLEMAAANKMKQKLAELEEFEIHGEEYSKMLKEASDLKKQVKNLTPKPEPGHMFSPEVYTQERKDNALWAKSPKQADKNLREVCGEVWRNASEIERDAIFEYTESFHKFNEPLRGIEYGTSEYKGVGNTDLNAGYANNGKFLNAMTDIIDKSSYTEDMWFQRGCSFRGMDKFFQCDEDLLRYGTQEALEEELLGKTVTEFGFMSMGSSKGKGFDGDIILNVYTPAGTKMMYVEPFSGFGMGDGRRWDGISMQDSFGGELETILQQGSQFNVTKIEKTPGTLFFDIEVIDQSNVQRWEE